MYSLKTFSTLTVCLFVAWVTEAQSQQASNPQTEEPILCRGNYHTEPEAVEQLARMSSTYSDLDGWKLRASRVREQILKGAKLDPLPKRTPLHRVVHKKRTYDGYSVESAAFEA